MFSANLSHYTGVSQMEKLLTASEVAAVLRLPLRSVHRIIQTKSIGHVRIGKLVRIPESMLYSFLKTREFQELMAAEMGVKND